MSDKKNRLANLSPEQRELLLKKLREQKKSEPSADRIVRRADLSSYPISSSQMRLWFLHQLEPESAFYNIPSAIRLTGQVNIDLLKSSIFEIIRRHEVLRAYFSVDEKGQPKQTISDSAKIEIPEIDLSSVSDQDKDRRIHTWLKKEAAKPFDISKAPMMRCALLKVKAREYVLSLNIHHIIADGWSIGIIISEILAIYRLRGQDSKKSLPELPIQFADYADWQNKRSTKEIIRKQLQYWNETLTGMPDVLDLHTDFPRPELQTYNGKHHNFTLSKSVTDRLRKTTTEYQVSLYALLMAVFQAFLHKISGQDEFGVGAPIANRNRAEIETLIGFFVNTVALHADFTQDLTFKEFVRKIKNDIITASDNQDIPFERIVEAVAPGPQLNHSPLFQVMFDLQKVPFEKLQNEEISLEILDIEIEVAKFDLMLLMLEKNDTIECTLEYNTDLFTASTIERFSRYFTILLENALHNPQAKVSSLALIGQTEQKRIIRELNQTASDYPRQASVQDIFEQQVRNAPDAMAVRYGGQSLTYRELSSKSNRLAHLLISKGVKKRDLVALYLDRSIEMIVGFMAILKAGAVYVPMDISYPKGRLSFILEDSAASLLLTQQALFYDLPESPVQSLAIDQEDIYRDLPDILPDIQNRAQDPAYIIYTSGSTGIPKGVVVPHRAINRLVLNTDYINITIDHKIAQVSNAAFDAATFEIWGALLNGAQLIGISKDVMLSSSDFIKALRQEKISHIFLTTALFNQMAATDPSAFKSLHTVMFGGEIANAGSVFKVYDAESPQNLLNVYGPTENTTFSTWYKVEKLQLDSVNVPIGKPIANSTCYVLDKNLRIVPVGVPGELYLGGDGLALEYFKRPDLTHEHFIPNPFKYYDDHVIYKTGDLVRLLEDGNIEFLDRIDQQVKIRGFRIELGEIESILKTNPQLKDATVIARQDNPGEKTLVAYFVQNQKDFIKASDLRSYLLEKLPDYMVPVSYVELDSIPLTPNGKIDRRALPDPDHSRPDLQGAYEAPRNELEQFLANVWAEILSLDKVGIKDNFFELGGNSLKAAVFTNRIQREFGDVIHVSMVFKAPTIAELAAYVVNYYHKIAYERFNLDASVEEIYKLVQVSEEVTTKIERVQIDEIRKIIVPLAPRKSVPAKKNPAAVFVLSPPRSGSTLLRVMLAGNQKLFSPPELDLLSFNSLQERHKAFSQDGLEIWLEATIRAIKELKHTDVEEAHKIMAGFEAQDLSVKDFYRELQDWMGDRILVDKSPTYPFDLNILERAEADFNQPKYIHLLRHPYAMIYSFIEAKLDKNFFRYAHNFTRRELAELIYVISHQNINSFLNHIPDERQLKLKFEELVNDPFREMMRLCTFLNIDFEPEMLKPYQGNKMTDGVSSHSLMVGDFKFYLRKNIDTSVANQWRNNHKQDFLGDEGWALAKTFGYAVEKEMAAKSDTTASKTITRIQPLSRKDKLPLSFAQQRLWFLDQMDPGDPQYNIPGAIRLKGKLDVSLLEKSLNLIIERHETLRTIFKSSDEGKASQIILPKLTLKLEHSAVLHAFDTELLKLANQEARLPFNLSTGPLLRARLLQINDQEYVFIVVMHHIVSDGWSVNVFVKELSVFYNALVKNKKVPLPALGIQYVDFAGWQRNWFAGDALQNQLDYWKNQLSGISPSLELPTDFKRPALVTHEGKRIVFRFPNTLFQKLNRLSKEKETTLFMTLLSAFETLLYRYSGQDDFAIGTPVANRMRDEIEPLIGFFVNTLVLRCTVNGNRSFSHLLRQVKKTAMEAYDHQDIPFEKLVDMLQPERNMSQTPLFQVMFSMQRSDVQEIELTGLVFRPFELESGSAKFDLNLEIVEHTNRIVAIMEYKTALFTESTIQKMLNHFRMLLEVIVDNPDQNISTLPLMEDEEKAQILSQWVPKSIVFQQDRCIHQLIEEQASSQPRAFAVGIYDQVLSFSDLNRRANQLAAYLIKAGVQQRSIIGILMERSTDMIVSMLAIWKTGNAYLPLDPAYPHERLTYMLEDARVPILLTHKALTDNLSSLNLNMICLDEQWPQVEQGKEDNPNLLLSSDDLAYIIYTSGSTGKPKGVMISHKSAMHLAANLDHTVYSNFPDQKLRISLNAPIPFDASVQQIVMLTYGHGLQIIPMEARGDGNSMLEYIRKYQIQILDCVPAQLKLMLEAGLLDANQFKPLAVLPGGEAIDEVTWQKLVSSKETRFFNMYGPTECAVDSTICNVRTSPDRPVIGKAVANARFYILDQNEQPVPEGVAGELHISGAGLARGYLSRPELTSEKFIANPFDRDAFSRMYKSGDLVRRLPDGNVEFLGRVDHQVKVRGFRMELGEIEACLRQHESIKDAVVLAAEVKKDDKRLVAYLLSEAEQKPNIGELRTFLKEALPDYMIPAIFMPLDSLPLLPNGKVNRKALPQPEFDRNDLGIEFIEASSDREKIFSEIWKAVLGIDQVGIQDNFFELGGDSILSIQVVARANQEGLKISPKQIFENPTIESLALVAGQVKVIEADQGIVSGSAELSPIQLEFFENKYSQPWHWNQSLVLEAATEIDEAILQQVMIKIMEHHDALRLRFPSAGQAGQATIAAEEKAKLVELFDLSELDSIEQEKAVQKHIDVLQASLNLEEGPIIRCAIIKRGAAKTDLIALVIHHLAIDGLSWRILSEDMQTAYGQLISGIEVSLPRKTTSFKQWTKKLNEFAQNNGLLEELDFWQTFSDNNIGLIQTELKGGPNNEASVKTISTEFEESFTELLLRDIHGVYNTQMNDILLTALVNAYKAWIGRGRMRLSMEGHGREEIITDVSLARTVGWFTSKYPVYLDLSHTSDPGKSIVAVKEQLRRIPNNGIGFGILKYLSANKAMPAKLAEIDEPEIVFNYLGQFQTDDTAQTLFKPLSGFNTSERSSQAERKHLIDISASVKNRQFTVDLGYSSNLFKPETMQEFLDKFAVELKKLVAFLQRETSGGYSPSDFQDVELDAEDLDDLLSELDED